MQFACPRAYLNTPSIGVPPVEASQVLLDAVLRWRAGDVQPSDYDSDVAVARRAFAEICGVPTATVAIGATVASLVATLAVGAPDGSRILTARGEFTSVTFPFAAQAYRGIVIDEAPLAEVPSRAAEYDIVAASAVQSMDGSLLDLDALRMAVGDTRTRVLLDVTQAAGWLPLELHWADAVVGAGYKWLMSPRGAAWMAIRSDYANQLVDVGANWYAAESRWDGIYGLPLRQARDNRRFDASPAWFSHLGAAAVMPWLASLDRGEVRRHCLGLADAFRGEFDLPPTGSAIVSVSRQGAAERLQRAGVVASVRGGAARVGFHIYNDADDLDRAVAALR